MEAVPSAPAAEASPQMLAVLRLRDPEPVQDYGGFPTIDSRCRQHSES